MAMAVFCIHSMLKTGCFTKRTADGVLHQRTSPLQSADLNLADMVWDDLDCRVKKNLVLKKKKIKQDLICLTYFRLIQFNITDFTQFNCKKRKMMLCVI